MDNQDTINCFNNVKETLLNTQSVEGLSQLTPRDIRNTIESYATTKSDKVRIEELIFEWLEQNRHSTKNAQLSPAEKYRRLSLTIENARKVLNSILVKRDKNLEKAERENFKNLTPENQTEFLLNISISIKGTDHGKCNINEYKDNMEWFLNMAIMKTKTTTDQNKNTRLIKILENMKYGFSDDTNGYPYLLFFLSELLWYEFILCREIHPYKEEIISLKRYKHKPEDIIWTKRLNYYKNIGERKKYIHSATLNSNKWAIPFKDFAKLYRVILCLSNKAITTPLK